MTDTGTLLFHLLIALVAAKLSAEASERVGVPGVVGEIIAGIVIGPSFLGWIGSDNFLLAIGELGVVLLLLEVGLEMDLAELAAVGRSALLVACAGVAAPLALGFVAMRLIGNDADTSLFVAAALTATSVGITARVFGDLRALATVEARIVLGAAVADDVIGLVILTVVVRLVTQHSASLGQVGSIIATAVAFLVVGGLVAIVIAPRLFAMVERTARSSGALIVIALGFTLCFASLADAAKLAPIVGAFLAGLALARSASADRIRRELAPISHVFVPLFFVAIGLHVEIGAFGRIAVLRDAVVLLAVAVVGKLFAAVGIIGAPGDKIMIGFGMLPRGEVGLIFAAIGLQAGVLGDDLYAALLLVVLVTTVVTPVLLRWRAQAVLRQSRTPTVEVPEPDAGWIDVRGEEIVFRATPPAEATLPLALEVALLADRYRPSADLLDWFGSWSRTPVTWSERASDAFLALLRYGGARAWRFLDALGVLEDAFPELSAAFRARRADAGILDGSLLHGWATLERVRDAVREPPLSQTFALLKHPERLLLAALLIDALPDRAARIGSVHAVGARLALDTPAQDAVATLVDQPQILWGMASAPNALREPRVFELAVHLATTETARAAYILAAAGGDAHELWQRQRLDALYELVLQTLADPTLIAAEARSLVSKRRAAAQKLAGDDRHAADRIRDASRAYLLSVPPFAIVRHAQLLNRVESRHAVVVEATPAETGMPDHWWIAIAGVDRAGLFANVSASLTDEGFDVISAILATWPDGVGLESFLVHGRRAPEPARIRQRIEVYRTVPLTSAPIADAVLTFDDTASPWHTVCELRATEQPGLAQRIAVAFAATNIDVHAAYLESDGGIAVDRFDVTDRNGAKLTAPDHDALRAALADGVLPAKGRRQRRQRRHERRAAGTVPSD